jgi:hypothetical protein
MENLPVPREEIDRTDMLKKMSREISYLAHVKMIFFTLSRLGLDSVRY